jgi:hypothetical protein
MHLLTPLLAAALICRVAVLSAQPITASPTNPSMGMRNLLSIRLEEPVVRVPSRVHLRWELASMQRGGYTNVERAAAQEGPYEVIAVLKQDSTRGEFTDEHPMKGRNFYRLRWVQEGGIQYISNIGQANLAGDMSCKFYPNPVDNMLIVRSEQPLDMVISDANGKSRFTMKLQPGLQTVDVSNLDKGLYIITLTQVESGRKITEKLVKN